MVSIPEFLMLCSLGAVLVTIHWILSVSFFIALFTTPLKHYLVLMLRSMSGLTYRSGNPLGSWENACVPDVQNRFSSMPDGVYRIKSKGVAIDRQRGVGVVRRGVFHTLYHVTRGGLVYWRGQAVQPHSGSVTEDVISYGGPWNLPKPELVNEIDVLACLPDGTVEYHKYEPSTITIDGTPTMFVTKDFGFGSSGSPFYLEGEPVGLYGYGFQYNGKYHSIVTTYEQDPNQVHLPGIDLTSTAQRTFID